MCSLSTLKKLSRSFFTSSSTSTTSDAASSWESRWTDHYLTPSLNYFLAKVDVVLAVDQLFCLNPLYAVPRAVMLDMLLGQPESVEYVSRTAPPAPPPSSE